MAGSGLRRWPGLVLGPGSGDVAVEKLRCLEDVSNVPALPAALITFMQRFAEWTLSPLGAVAKMILSQPAALAPAALQKRFFRPKSLPAKQRMTPARQRVLGALADGAHLTAKDLSVAADASPAVIAAMATQGLLGVDHVAQDQPPAVPRCDLPGLTLAATQAAAQVREDELRVALADATRRAESASLGWRRGPSGAAQSAARCRPHVHTRTHYGRLPLWL